MNLPSSKNINLNNKVKVLGVNPQKDTPKKDEKIRKKVIDSKN
jgi:hypothetical protein